MHLTSIAYGRTWTDKKGRHITADYVSLLQLDEPKVKLLKPNGEYILVPVKALSKEDQDYIQGLNGDKPVNSSTDNNIPLSTDNNIPLSTENNIPQGANNKKVTESVVYPTIKNMDINSREAYEALIQIRDEDVTKIEPDYTIALLFIFTKKDYLHAQQHLNRCLKIKPDDAGTLLNLGTVSILQGKYPEAFSFYQRAFNAGGVDQTLNQNIHKLIDESNSRNIILPATARSKFAELAGNVSKKVKKQFNPKQGWLFEKCSEGLAHEDQKCHWFQLAGYRPYEFPICMKCNGTGKAYCPNKNCSGGKVPYTEKVARTFPDGKTVYMPTRKFKTCNVCDGSSRVKCTACNGSGVEISKYEVASQLNKEEREREAQQREREAQQREREAQARREAWEKAEQERKEAQKREAQARQEAWERELQAKKEAQERAERERKEAQERAERERKEEQERDLKELEYALKNRSVVVNDCTICIGKIRIVQNVLLENGYSGRRSYSEDDNYLVLDVYVFNKSATKKINFDSWAGDRLNLGSKARLRDEYDNPYKRIVFGAGTLIAGNKPNHSIYPDDVIIDRLVFETPIKTAKKLTLILPGENIGSKGDFKIEFDTSDIHK